jgi:GNAT superfamily N-acetyltransferase
MDRLLILWTSVFNAEPSAFTFKFDATPPEHRRVFVAESGDKIVASVVLFGIPIRDDSKKDLLIGGVANVATHPDFRRKGISGRLLDMAKAEMIERGYDWGLLFTGTHSFYEQHGWRTIYRSYVSVHIGSLALTRHSGDVALQTQPDLVRLRALSDASFRTPLSQLRTDLDWSYKIPYRITSKAVFMGERSFAVVRENVSTPVLEEWGMPEPSIEEFENLLVAISHWAEARGSKNLIVSAPIMAEARQAMETLFSHVVDVEEAEAMVLPLKGGWHTAQIISLFALPEARFFRMDNF